MRKNIYLLLFWLGLAQGIFAAAPVTHVYLTDLWFKYHEKEYSDKDRHEFIVGTLFPDIRYLGNVSRVHTHEKQLTLKNIKEEKDPFQAGKKFHSYVDEQREAWVEEWGIYHLLPKMNNKREQGMLLKVIEDELYFDKTDLKRARDALHTIEKEELKFGISEDEVELWHQILRHYMSNKPSTLLFEFGHFPQHFVPASMEKIEIFSDELNKLSSESHMHEYVIKLSKAFEEQFKQ